MNQEILAAWAAALRDPKYIGKEDWQFVWRISLKAGERFNPFGVLLEVMHANPELNAVLEANLIEGRSSATLQTNVVGKGPTTLSVLTLAFGADGQTYTDRLPPELEALVGLDKVEPVAVNHLIALNKREPFTPFSELAIYIEFAFN